MCFKHSFHQIAILPEKFAEIQLRLKEKDIKHSTPQQHECAMSNEGYRVRVPSSAPLKGMCWWLQSHFQLLEINVSSVSSLEVSRMTAKGRIFRQELYLQMHPLTLRVLDHSGVYRVKSL